jgi:hypothetical protein
MADVVCELARYLRANPLACDSLEGISRWWLAAYRVPSEELLVALRWMTVHGLVEEIAAADGRLRYRRGASEATLDAAIASYCSDSGMGH